MQAATLHCPNCGAPAAPDATVCAYCHARLAAVSCPSCFGLAFAGMTHCPHCGATLARHEEPVDDAAALACPRGDGELRPVRVGETRLRECAACAGVWMDRATFLALCRERLRQAEFPAGRPPLARDAGLIDVEVHYLRCPVCRELMSRVNFAHRSGVVVDTCAAHGIWFDRDELQRIVDFIRAGRLSVAWAVTLFGPILPP